MLTASSRTEEPMLAVGETEPRLPASAVPIAPFVKWAGGKRQLLPQLLALRPPRFSRYVEPFLGGGALYFALAPGRAVLGDLNSELIDAYRTIRDDVEGVMAALDRHRYDRDHYYAVRRLRPDQLSAVERAARFIFLNKTGYNGLYRVNRRGEFNVPFGRYRTPPRLYDAGNLRAAAALLAGAEIRHGPYEETLATAGAGDFVYLAPPYQPLSPSANFTRYTRDGFGPADQQRLADEFRRLDALGAYVMLSNSDTPLVRELYRGFSLVEVHANRLINSDHRGRTGITELVIRNYR
jgi:DNA adenine methylase